MYHENGADLGANASTNPVNVLRIRGPVAITAFPAMKPAGRPGDPDTHHHVVGSQQIRQQITQGAPLGERATTTTRSAGSGPIVSRGTVSGLSLLGHVPLVTGKHGRVSALKEKHRCTNGDACDVGAGPCAVAADEGGVSGGNPQTWSHQ